jgi:hypothetical protein
VLSRVPADAVSEVGPELRLIVEGWKAAALSGDADLVYFVTAPRNFSPAFIARHEALLAAARPRESRAAHARATAARPGRTARASAGRAS